MSIFFLSSIIAAYYTTKNVRFTTFVALLALIICMSIYSFLTQWKEIILSVVMLLFITYLDTSTINTIVIIVLYNTIYINLVFNPEWSRRKERLQAAVDKSNNNLAIDSNLYEDIKNRNKTISTMLMYSLSVLPSVALKIMQEKKDTLLSFLPVKMIYLNYLKVFNLSDNSPVDLKRFLVGLLRFFFFMLITLTICFMIKEQRILRNKLRIKRQRDISYWGNSKPDLEPFDLLFIDRNLSDPDFCPTPSQNGIKCRWNGKNSRYEVHCDECNHFLECFPEYNVKNNYKANKSNDINAQIKKIVDE